MWKSINVNCQNIKVSTDRAVLIAMPHNSKYDGFKFWHPARLVRTGRHSNAKSISYNENFSFELLKFGNGRYNSSIVIQRKVIDVEDFEEAFGIMDQNIVSSKNEESYLIIQEPEKIDREVCVAKELKNE